MTRAGDPHNGLGGLGGGAAACPANGLREAPHGQAPASARSEPTAILPDDRLRAYLRAFPGCGADSVTFLWKADSGLWFRVRLQADPAPGLADVPGCQFAAEQVALPHRLTPRELDVLTLLAVGLRNPEIGAVLFASPRTVSTHVEHILAKLGQPSRTAAASVAVDRGYLRLPLPGNLAERGSLTVCRLHGRVSAADDSSDPADGESGGWPSVCRATRPAERPLRLGSAFPLAGLAADDGQQMRNGSALAIADINARGGIGGRPIEQLVVDVDIFSPEGVERAFRQLFEADVDALTSGYVFPEHVAAGLAAAYGAPYVHAMTSQSQAEIVRDNHSAFRNVFQVCPTEVNYGPGFIRFLEHERGRGWQPPSRRIAFVDTDLPSGQMVNARTVSAAERAGWEISAARTVPAIGADWAALIDDLERVEPAAVLIAQFLADELAGFQRLAAARLPATVIYAIYAPSVPEFLESAGTDAEGLVWATVTGTYDDSIGRRFRAEYADAYGQPPGWSHAGIAYDEVHLLAHAWMAVPHPRDFAAVSRELRRLRYRGVNGSYFLDNAEQSGLGFPDTTSDPSLGLAHLVLQIQNGVHRIISPAPYAEARFRDPLLLSHRRLRGTSRSMPAARYWGLADAQGKSTRAADLAGGPGHRGRVSKGE